MSYSLLWLSIYIKLYLIPMVQTYVTDPMAGNMSQTRYVFHMSQTLWLETQTLMCLRQSYTLYRSVN
jgi:hypothetical protein